MSPQTKWHRPRCHPCHPRRGHRRPRRCLPARRLQVQVRHRPDECSARSDARPRSRVRPRRRLVPRRRSRRALRCARARSAILPRQPRGSGERAACWVRVRPMAGETACVCAHVRYDEQGWGLGAGRGRCSHFLGAGNRHLIFTNGAPFTFSGGGHWWGARAR